MKEYLLKLKEIQLTIHDCNYNRRVRYNTKDFDILLVRLTDKNGDRLFGIKSYYLPVKDSIHLKYNPLNCKVSWSPKSLDEHIEEMTKLL